MASPTIDGSGVLVTVNEQPSSKPSADRGTLLVISGPSGVGKSTLVARLRERVPFHFSVSVTTRHPRPGETEGIEYHFVNRSEFEAMVEDGGLLEWAEYSRSLYGTPRGEVVRKLEAGQNVLLDIENRGARQIKASYPESLTVFLAPPSMEILEERLRNRGDTSPEQVRARLAVAQLQLEEAREHYDAVVVNDDVERAVNEIMRILSVHERGLDVE